MLYGIIGMIDSRLRSAVQPDPKLLNVCWHQWQTSFAFGRLGILDRSDKDILYPCGRKDAPWHRLCFRDETGFSRITTPARMLA